MKGISEQKTHLAFALTFVLLLVNATFSYWNNARIKEKEERVVFTHEVLDTLDTLLSTMKDAETGQRGYRITGDPAFLKPYQAAIGQIQGQYEQLRRLTATNLDNQRHLPLLQQQIAAALQSLKEVVELPQAHEPEPALRRAMERAKTDMDRFRESMRDMKGKEERLLRRRAEVSKAANRTGLLLLAVTTILSLGFVGLCYYLVIRNFNLRKLVEKNLRRAKERFELAAKAVTSVIYEWDFKTNLIARARGSAADQDGDAGDISLSADRFFDLVHPQDRSRLQKEIQDALAHGDGYRVEYRLGDGDGCYRWIWDRALILRDADLKPLCAIGSALDISERKQAEEVLREADRRKDEFLAMLAHELRNPLAPIRNGLQVMKQLGKEGTPVERIRETMERQVQHLGRLVDDLLDVAQIIHGKIQLRKEPVPLSAVVQGAVEISRPFVEACRHQLTINLPSEPLELEADPTRLKQVLVNLLINAAKYTKEGGAISLNAAQEDSQIVIRVSDNGLGLAPEMFDRIFEPFEQLPSEPGQNHGGLGIGLTLVRRLVELHGGWVTATSAGLGRGSEFSVHLPLRPEVVGPAPAPPDAEVKFRPNTNSPKYRVMVVDDNVDAANTLASWLRLEGHEVRVAKTGPAALALAVEADPQIVFLDLGMPGMDGYEVARQLRQRFPESNLRIIALTGWGHDEARRRSKESGFDDHLVKPVEPDTIHAVLAGQTSSTGCLN